MCLRLKYQGSINKFVVAATNNIITVITNYPLKKESKKMKVYYDDEDLKISLLH